MDNYQTKNSTETEALEVRIKSQSNQSVDLNAWIEQNMTCCSDQRVLELCCGTGSQTAIFAKHIRNGEIFCSDINSDSIEQNRLRVNGNNINYIVSDIDELPDNVSGKFDVIFCAYGFYYSSNPDLLFSRLVSKLKAKGKFILVGPTLGNNAELYQLLSSLNIEIPAPVLESSEEFMLGMHRMFLQNFDSVRFLRIKNKVSFGSAEGLFKYWQKTTFYCPENDGLFLEVSPEIFNENFELTKSIALLQGEKAD